MNLGELLESDVVAAARHLLGWELRFGPLRARIVEAEAYRTPDDPACHAHRGQTPRNATMFGPAGKAYVYFTYGNHWMLNVVAHEPGNAAAVLIRALEPLEGLDEMRGRRLKATRDEDLLSGPGKLCQAFGITGELDGVDLFDGQGLHLVEGAAVTDVLTGSRIGITSGKEWPWRFVDAKAIRWASRPIKDLA
ncbi:MAG: DNA-3-methyladenine glycosylase [Armatimonadetes bacterium]|nr:DNA-3-methyladenine glycosylase [Armatimonadota bacterium]